MKLLARAAEANHQQMVELLAILSFASSVPDAHAYACVQAVAQMLSSAEQFRQDVAKCNDLSRSANVTMHGIRMEPNGKFVLESLAINKPNQLNRHAMKAAREWQARVNGLVMLLSIAYLGDDTIEVGQKEMPKQKEVGDYTVTGLMLVPGGRFFLLASALNRLAKATERPFGDWLLLSLDATEVPKGFYVLADGECKGRELL